MGTASITDNQVAQFKANPIADPAARGQEQVADGG